MPIDPRTPLGAQVAQIDSPLVALSQIAQLQQHRAQAKAQQAAAQEAAAKRARQAAIDQALSAASGPAFRLSGQPGMGSAPSRPRACVTPQPI